MQWDVGLTGIGLLVGLSLGFGLLTQACLYRRSRPWFWAAAAGGYFVAGVLTSELWFGWATEEDLQPNIDGVSFDEVLMADLVLWVGAVLAVWLVRRRHRHHGSHPLTR